jgi:hypothetical protein
MPDYSKAKIYRVYCGDDEYIGSTIRPLSERMNDHRKGYKNGNVCSSRILFEKHGVENCKIELIEDYPCERKEQLNKREGEVQRERNCVNKYIAGRTIKEWIVDNNYNDTYHKEYYLKNKERISARKIAKYLTDKN